MLFLVCSFQYLGFEFFDRRDALSCTTDVGVAGSADAASSDDQEARSHRVHIG